MSATRSAGRGARPTADERRDAIVDAAAEVLRTQGVAACTARSIAAASPLTKSAIHYYFSDVDEIVDAAFRRLMEAYLARIERAAADAAAPLAWWQAAHAYLTYGVDRGDRSDRVPLLWFDYQVTRARHGRTGTSAELTDRTVALFHRLVADAGVDDAAARAEALFSALVGQIVRASMHAVDVDAVLGELATALGLPAPARR
jgi:AcrR family transcriptional regulator